MAYEPQHFSREEFGEWWLRLVEPWLVRADALRAAWGAPLIVSDAEGALGRRLGPDAGSWHNVDAHDGMLFAVDLFPKGLATVEQAEDFLLLAKNVGFTGIGFYPHWSRPGWHLDVRTDRRIGDPAMWGALTRNGEQEYVSFERALNAFAEQALAAQMDA